MLDIVLDLNDFFMIGDDILVQYRRNSTKGRVLVSVQAPDGVEVVHSAPAEEGA